MRRQRRARSGTARLYGPRPEGVTAANDHRLRGSTINNFIRSNPRTYRYASLVMAGLVPDPDVIPANARARTWGAAQRHALGPPPGLTMFQAYKKYTPYDGTMHVASCILFGPAAGFGTASDVDQDGMPRDEVEHYLAPGSRMLSDLHEAVLAALRLPPGVRTLNFPANVRIDLTFTTVARNPLRPEETARIGGAQFAELPIPNFFTNRFKATNDDSLCMKLAEYIEEFRTYVEDLLPNEGSDRELHTLVSADVHAHRTAAVAAQQGPVGGSTRFAKFDRPAVEVPEGKLTVPDRIYSSSGLIVNWGTSGGDEKCVGRAIMTAFDEMIASRDDAYLINILRSARVGLNSRRKQVQKLHESTPEVSATVAANRVALVQKLNKESAELERLYTTTEASYFLAGCHVRPEMVSQHADKYRLRSRVTTIERQLKKAFDGEHPVFDFRDPFFHSAQEINDTTVARIRSSIKPGHLVKLQFLSVGAEDKVVFTHRDPGATLDFLCSSPHARVINIFYAWQHASVITSIGACCNHKMLDTSGADRLKVGYASDRTYCSLCGFFVGRGIGDHLLIFEHQKRGCSFQTGVEMTVPNSQANRCQFRKADYPALIRPLVMAVMTTTSNLSSASLSISGLLPSGWHSIDLPYIGSDKLYSQNADKWSEIRDRVRGISIIDVDVLPKPGSTVPISAEATEHGTAVNNLLTIVFAQFNVDLLFEHLRFVCPKSHASEPPTGDPLCDGCLLPVSGPTRWQYQDVGQEDDASSCDSVEEEEEKVTACEDRRVPVIHHDHAMGIQSWAHKECNLHIRQSTTRLVVFVDDVRTLAALVDVTCEKTFINSVMHGRLPRLQRKNGIVSSLTLSVRKKLLIIFRLRSAFFSTDAPTTSVQMMSEMIGFAEKMFAVHKVWPFHFPTLISYHRALLHRMACQVLHPTESCTSISDHKILEVVNRMMKGGRIVIGEQAELMPLENPHDRRTVRIVLDANSLYPHQLRSWKIPSREDAAEEIAFNISGAEKQTQDGMNYIEYSDLYGDYAEWIVLSGYWPKEIQRKLKRFPPFYGSLRVTGSMLSRFQRQKMGVLREHSFGIRNVAHFYPLVDEVVFMREAKILTRLGLVVTNVRAIYRVPASLWGQPYAEMNEKLRRQAQSEDDIETSNSIKAASNTVIGSLNMNVGSYTSLNAVKNFDDDDDDEDKMSVIEKYADSWRFTLRMSKAKDLLLFEMRKGSWKHRQQTLANLFIVAMARCDLVTFAYGYVDRDFGRLTAMQGIFQVFPTAKVIYGCTDSLILELHASESFTDVRHELFHHFSERLDISNVPLTSTFYTTMDPCMRRHAEMCRRDCRGRSGYWKSEDGFGGVEGVVINGPNRYAWRAVQHPTDTLRKFKGADTLKGLPKQWQGMYSMEHFAASLYDAELPPVGPPLKRLTSAGDLSTLSEASISRSAVSIWGHCAARVDRLPPNNHTPLGYTGEEADEDQIEDAAEVFAALDRLE